MAAVAGYLLANAIVLGANALMLVNAGEALSVQTSLKRQMQAGGLQSSAFDDVALSPLIKFARYQALKPDVIALGTSRVLQFRPSAFSASFVNMGMLFTLERAPEIVSALLERHKPKLVLLGVEWWWFNDAFPQPDIGPLRGEWSRKLTDWPRSLKGWLKYRREVLLQPTRWLFEGKIGPRDYAATLLHPTPQIGVPAIAEASGAGPRGSYYYARVSSRGEDWQFRHTLMEVRDGRGQFTPGDVVSEDRWQIYEQMIELFRAAGIEVVPFMPPIANGVLEAVAERGGYGIFADLRERLRGYHGFVHDFTEPASVGSTDCEFLDGFHGGEVTYLRLLTMLASGHAELAKLIDANAVAYGISRYSGRATAYESVPGGARIREVDFLGLGCSKQ